LDLDPCQRQRPFIREDRHARRSEYLDPELTTPPAVPRVEVQRTDDRGALGVLAAPLRVRRTGAKNVKATLHPRRTQLPYAGLSNGPGDSDPIRAPSLVNTRTMPGSLPDRVA